VKAASEILAVQAPLGFQVKMVPWGQLVILESLAIQGTQDQLENLGLSEKRVLV